MGTLTFITAGILILTVQVASQGILRMPQVQFRGPAGGFNFRPMPFRGGQRFGPSPPAMQRNVPGRLPRLDAPPMEGDFFSFGPIIGNSLTNAVVGNGIRRGPPPRSGAQQLAMRPRPGRMRPPIGRGRLLLATGGFPQIPRIPQIPLRQWEGVSRITVGSLSSRSRSPQTAQVNVTENALTDGMSSQNSRPMNTITRSEVSEAARNFREQPTTSNGQVFPIIPASNDQASNTANFPTQRDLASSQPGANVIFPSQTADAPVFVSQRVPRMFGRGNPNEPPVPVIPQIPNAGARFRFRNGPPMPRGGQGLNVPPSSMFGQDSFTRRFANVPPPPRPFGRFNGPQIPIGRGMPGQFPNSQQSVNSQMTQTQSVGINPADVQVVTLPQGFQGQFRPNQLGSFVAQLPTPTQIDQFQNQQQFGGPAFITEGQDQGGPAFHTNSNPQQDFSIQFQSLPVENNVQNNLGMNADQSQSVQEGLQSSGNEFQLIQIDSQTAGSNQDTAVKLGSTGQVTEVKVVGTNNAPEPVIAQPVDLTLMDQVQGDQKKQGKGQDTTFNGLSGDITVTGDKAPKTPELASPLVEQDFSFFVNTEHGGEVQTGASMQTDISAQKAGIQLVASPIEGLPNGYSKKTADMLADLGLNLPAPVLATAPGERTTTFTFPIQGTGGQKNNQQEKPASFSFVTANDSVQKGETPIVAENPAEGVSYPEMRKADPGKDPIVMDVQAEGNAATGTTK